MRIVSQKICLGRAGKNYVLGHFGKQDFCFLPNQNRREEELAPGSTRPRSGRSRVFG